MYIIPTWQRFIFSVSPFILLSFHDEVWTINKVDLFCYWIILMLIIPTVLYNSTLLLRLLRLVPTLKSQEGVLRHILRVFIF